MPYVRERTERISSSSYLQVRFFCRRILSKAWKECKKNRTFLRTRSEFFSDRMNTFSMHVVRASWNSTLERHPVALFESIRNVPRLSNRMKTFRSYRCTRDASDGDVVDVHFVDEGIRTEAQSGENLLDVALRCGVEITTGCLSGSCGSCEMEMIKRTRGSSSFGSSRVVRTCVGVVPRQVDCIEIRNLQDPLWGRDQWI